MAAAAAAVLLLPASAVLAGPPKPRTTPAPPPAAKPSPKPSPMADPNVVLRPDLGVAFSRPAGYFDADLGGAATPAAGGVAYRCVGPIENGVAANVNLTVTPGPAEGLPPGAAKALAAVLAKRLPKQSRFKVVKTGETTLAGGERAAVVSATMVLDGRPMRNCQVAVGHGGRLYVFTFTASAAAYNARVPALFRLLSGLRWLS